MCSEHAALVGSQEHCRYRALQNINHSACSPQMQLMKSHCFFLLLLFFFLPLQLHFVNSPEFCFVTCTVFSQLESQNHLGWKRLFKIVMSKY